MSIKSLNRSGGWVNGETHIIAYHPTEANDPPLQPGLYHPLPTAAVLPTTLTNGRGVR
jgi:hypothetical protein